ncbi:MAG: PD40 domain-containing protein [Ignavibacteriales bacterium]|nr:MAG: PD40 domain-containing protein [Ignavibacteriales bacterium]
MKNFLAGFIFIVLMSNNFYGQIENHLLRNPAISPDGSRIAFSYQGDIWVVSAFGGNADRLTIHEGYETSPCFSPDGSMIAFSGARYGNSDVYIVNVLNGSPERLTYHSANDNVTSWHKDKGIIFTTVRDFNQLEREAEIFSVSPYGGTESRILNSLGSDAVVSPQGRFIAFTRHSNSIFRESYKGPANRDIWVYDTQSDNYHKISTSDANDFMPKWSGENQLYFISAESNKYNLYKVSITSGGERSGTPVQVTSYNDYGVRSFDITADGSKIIMERGIDLLTLNTNDNSVSPVNINVTSDYRFDPVEFKSFSKDASEYVVSPNGKLLAFVVRGEVFIKEADKEKSRSVNVSDSPFRDMNPSWLSDSTLVFISDRDSSQYDIFMVRSADKNQSNIFKSLKHELIKLTSTSSDESNPSVSPDGKKIIYTTGNAKVIVADISADGKLSNGKILNANWAAFNNIVWSPDSKWIAYSQEDLYFNEEVFILAADSSKGPINVSMHPRSDNSPFWSKDGTKLGFISARNNRNNDVWFAWLTKEDWEKTKEDWEEKEPAAEDKPDKKDSKSEDKPKVKEIKIDIEGIHNRLLQVTSFPGDEGNVTISKDGETFYYTAVSSNAKGRDLFSIKWDGKDLKEITKGGTNPSGVSIDAEGKYLYYFKQGGSINRQDLKSDKSESIPYSAKMKIDYVTERHQIFDEAWRAIRDNFYDPNYHGKDWSSLKDKYEPLCMAASTENDFRDMFNYMLGELNASHMGMYGSDRSETQKDVTGMLGVELVQTSAGMKVIRVIPDSPADKISSKLNADDIITAIDGTPVDSLENFYQMLQNSADEKLVLTVKDKELKEREIVIRPSSNVRSLLYEEWVLNRKKLTDQYSNGRLGYIHIQGMSIPSFEVFERALTEAGNGKEGLVVDVRYNGGGWTTDYLMAVLNYKQHAYTIPRGASDNLEADKLNFRNYYPTGERLIFAAWLKPSIAMCNEDSYSNAEIFSHAYKTLGIGTLVGKPTNGSVISTGAKGLIDGSYVRLPFRGWFTKATDKNQELGPAVPDIIIENSADAKSKDVDEQLKAAVDQLLKEIDSMK